MDNDEEVKEALKQITEEDAKKEIPKKEKEFYKKWWFWLILLAIVIIIGFTIIMIVAFNTIKGEVGDLAIEIQEIYEDATVYSSAGSNTLFIELRNWDNQYANQLSEIIKAVKTRINNNELSLYNELVTLSYIKSAEKEEVLLIREAYSLPDFTQDNTNTKEYILYTEYKDLYNVLSNTWDGYTNLFNSIY